MWRMGVAIVMTMTTVSGCEHTGSNTPTEKLQVGYSVNATGSTVQVQVGFTDLVTDPVHPTSVQLDDDDSLVFTFRGQSTTLNEIEDPAGNAWSYSAAIEDIAVIDDNEVTVLDLQRGTYASASVMTTMPATLLVDPLPATTSRAADLVVTWTPASDDQITWQAAPADCFIFYSPAVDNPIAAMMTIDANTITTFDPSATCIGDLTMVRQRTQSPDSPFTQFVAQMYVVTNVPLTSTP